MKKKLLIILGSTFVAIAITIVGAGIYINSHIDEIVREQLGAEIQFEDVEFFYSPMPTIVVKNITIDRGDNKATIPSLKLYPDLAKLLSGSISMKKVILDAPLLLADLSTIAGDEQAPGDRKILTTDSIPAQMFAGIVVNDGKMVLKARDASLQPVSFAIAMEKVKKKGQNISVKLQKFSIDEIGLKFAGDISIESFSPLKIKVEAPEAAINPEAVKAFLVKFGFIQEEISREIPAVKSVEAKGLKLDLDPEAGKIILSSEAFNFDQNQIKNTTINLAKEGAYELTSGQILLNMETVFRWVRESPKGKKALEDLLLKAKLKDLSATGTLELSSLTLKGIQGENPKVNGSLDIKTKGLKIHMVADNGKEQDFTISDLDTRVTIKEGTPSVEVNSLQMGSLGGGTGTLEGIFTFPMILKEVKFSSNFQAFKVFDTTLDLKASKERNKGFYFDLDLQNPSLKVAAKGELQSQPNKKTDFRARLADLKIFNALAKDTEANAADPSEKPVNFNFNLVKSRDFFGAASVKAFRYNDFPALKNIDLTVKCINDKAVIQGTVQVCHIPLSLQAVVIPPNLIAAQLEGKGANINLTSFISCFSKELPLFLKGRLSIASSLFTQGTNAKALVDSLQGEVMLTLNHCTVHRLSNLDYRLGFLMDILGAAGISSLKEDSITFRKGIARANLSKGRMILDTFTLKGPLLNTVGSGEFILKEKRLKISGQVQTAMGITEEFVIDKILTERET